MVQSINGTTPLEEARAALSNAYDLGYTRAVAQPPNGSTWWSHQSPVIPQRPVRRSLLSTPLAAMET